MLVAKSVGASDTKSEAGADAIDWRSIRAEPLAWDLIESSPADLAPVASYEPGQMGWERGRGRPLLREELTLPQIHRAISQRRRLDAAGPLRAQAALSLLRRDALPADVVARAQLALDNRAYTEAQRDYDDARRRGEQLSAARTRRAQAATPNEVAEVELARHLAKTLPSRPRGGRDEWMVAAHVIESESKRLQRIDAWQAAQEDQFCRLVEPGVQLFVELGAEFIRWQASVTQRRAPGAVPSSAAAPLPRPGTPC